jgi:hypothetical protein
MLTWAGSTYDINYPYCVTYLWATTASPNQVFSLFNCDTHDWAGQQILSAEPFAVTTTGTSSAPGGQATVPANDGSNSTSSNNNSGNSGTPVGAIVGGVIGGLAVIGIVVLGVVFMPARPRRRGCSPVRRWIQPYISGEPLWPSCHQSRGIRHADDAEFFPTRHIPYPDGFAVHNTPSSRGQAGGVRWSGQD